MASCAANKEDGVWLKYTWEDQIEWILANREASDEELQGIMDEHWKIPLRVESPSRSRQNNQEVTFEKRQLGEAEEEEVPCSPEREKKTISPRYVIPRPSTPKSPLKDMSLHSRSIEAVGHSMSDRREP
jgi:hypothetical protein